MRYSQSGTGAGSGFSRVTDAAPGTSSTVRDRVPLHAHDVLKLTAGCVGLAQTPRNISRTPRNTTRDSENMSRGYGNMLRELGNILRTFRSTSQGPENTSHDFGDMSRGSENMLRSPHDMSRDLQDMSRSLRNTSRTVENTSRDLRNMSRDSCDALLAFRQRPSVSIPYPWESRPGSESKREEKGERWPPARGAL